MVRGGRRPPLGRPRLVGTPPVRPRAAPWANRNPSIEEQAGDSASDRPQLAGCPGYQRRSVVCHAPSLLAPGNRLILSKLQHSEDAVRLSACTDRGWPPALASIEPLTEQLLGSGRRRRALR